MFFLKAYRRRRLLAKPFPSEWQAFLESNFAYYAFLNPEERLDLRNRIRIFLNEKHFEGCGGLVMTDEIRIAIAAQACLLLLNRETDYFPRLETILVYPSPFYVQDERRLPDGTVSLEREVRSGESWDLGVVVLAWDEVLAGMRDFGDGFNVVLHEFAHQLDGEYGSYEGAPELPDGRGYAEWAAVLGEEFQRLRRDLRRRRNTLLDPYAATNPAEFFAVATEFFFECPMDLEKEHPDLYAQLKRFYCQDPADRIRLLGGESVR